MPCLAFPKEFELATTYCLWHRNNISPAARAFVTLLTGPASRTKLAENGIRASRPVMWSRPGRRIYWLAAILAAVLIWIGIDVFGPTRSDLREFDPEGVARLETGMWRSYYDR
jgi:hypothetical protein